eukprot:1160872-Pelagomonas_calceolata.AAC.6
MGPEAMKQREIRFIGSRLSRWGWVQKRRRPTNKKAFFINMHHHHHQQLQFNSSNGMAWMLIMRPTLIHDYLGLLTHSHLLPESWQDAIYHFFVMTSSESCSSHRECFKTYPEEPGDLLITKGMPVGSPKGP